MLNVIDFHSLLSLTWISVEKVVALLPTTPFLYHPFKKLSLGSTSCAHAAGNKLEGGSITVISKPACIGKRENKHAIQIYHMLIDKFSRERCIHPAFGTKRVDKTWRLKFISLSRITHSGGSMGLSASSSASSHRWPIIQAIITRSCGRAGVISLRKFHILTYMRDTKLDLFYFMINHHIWWRYYPALPFSTESLKHPVETYIHIFVLPLRSILYFLVSTAPAAHLFSLYDFGCFSSASKNLYACTCIWD